MGGENEDDEDTIQKEMHWWSETEDDDEASDEHQEGDDTDDEKDWELEDDRSHNDAEQEEEAEEEAEEEKNEDNEPDDTGDSLISPSLLEGQKTRRRRSQKTRRRRSCIAPSRGGMTGSLPGTLPIGNKPMPRTPGCCKIGRCCMDCGAGGLGICHMNAAKCGSPVCGGRFDASAVAPKCR